MTIEVFLTKRPAKYANEVGLFPNSAMSQEDFDTISTGEVRAELTTESNLSDMKFVWGLAGILVKNTEYYLDKDEAMDGPKGLKFLARHCKFVTDPITGEITVRTKSLRRLSKEAFDRLKARMIYVALHDLLPGVSEDALRQEILDYIDGKKGEGK